MVIEKIGPRLGVSELRSVWEFFGDGLSLRKSLKDWLPWRIEIPRSSVLQLPVPTHGGPVGSAANKKNIFLRCKTVSY